MIGTGGATEEFLDRWRTPGDIGSKLWEERFGETRYVDLGIAAWEDALDAAGLTADQVDRVVDRHLARPGRHRRSARSWRSATGWSPGSTPRSASPAPPSPACCWPTRSTRAAPGQVVALVVLADGADVVLFRTTDALAAGRPVPSVADQVAAGAPIAYGKYLAWRGFLPVEPPRRPEPARPSASAAGRSADWKFGFVGSQDADGVVHLPPAPGDDAARPMADATGTIVTSTVDRLAYSPSPAGRVRRRRLRRGRPPAGRAHRRRRRRT